MKTSILKEFGNDKVKVKELVALKPKIEQEDFFSPLKNIFSLRIDADEYEKEAFRRYKSLFDRYSGCLTIFFCAGSFEKAGDEILGCKDLGMDVQSHGFYHHVYNDYKNNRYNIRKAKTFFKDKGIETIGFAAPMGKWNWPLMQALEDEGYEYSSDFAYDYLGLPRFPYENGKKSSILEIPIFPVAPELFFQKERYEFKDILNYYKGAIDEMVACNLPVIIYGHTSTEHYSVPKLLSELAEYAISAKGLKPKDMTEICKAWKAASNAAKMEEYKVKMPGKNYLGEIVNMTRGQKFKDSIKELVDFERVTPKDELQCSGIRKILKVLLRKFL